MFGLVYASILLKFFVAHCFISGFKTWGGGNVVILVYYQF